MRRAPLGLEWLVVVGCEVVGGEGADVGDAGVKPGELVGELSQLGVGGAEFVEVEQVSAQ